MILTPMMTQYQEIKENYKDCILFFRLGDFYEMFFDDALTASREMEITLTGRDCGQEARAPMCGVPYHAADVYIAKLVNKGYKVAICEQVEDPALAKGIVKREVVRIVTPGTVLSQTILDEKENNYLVSIYMDETGAGLAFTDLSTGELKATEFDILVYRDMLRNEIAKIHPKEIVGNVYMQNDDFLDDVKFSSDAYCETIADGYFNTTDAEELILRQFKLKTLSGLGIDANSHLVKALGALLSYLFSTQKHTLSHINNLQIYNSANHMALDKSALRNLEITETLIDQKTQGSLLGILDKTHTAMGSRKMKRWLREPLNQLSSIQERLDSVEILTNDILLRNDLKEALKQIYDLERLSGRIGCGNANGRDLSALKQSIFVIPELKSELSVTNAVLLNKLNDAIDSLNDLYSLIHRSIASDPPYTIKEGGLIKAGYSDELDQVKFSIRDRQNWIGALESVEKERTGIKSLKVGFNKVFGYYIEITKSYFHLIPDNYIRKQTLANCERFITQELKEAEALVLNAEAKINQLEYQIFTDIRTGIQEFLPILQKTSDAIASLDVLLSFAEISVKLGYIKPSVNSSNILEIVKGRHPVIEQTIKNGLFVSNDTYADSSDSSLLLITGPNMSGKSTYMRQTALIVLMAQSGCFIPAESAEIGIVDKIFTRIGASDNLSQGQSTFFVEMTELAYILNTATDKSLVLLDEIGRGTSTYDGLSIAWAVVEYLCNKKNRIKTLFATHYHELTQLEGIIKGFKNLNVDVKDTDGSIVFLHKIVSGSASRSYGIHVARLAGVPRELLDVAEKKLSQLESTSVTLTFQTDLIKEDTQSVQISLFDDVLNPIIEKVRALDLMSITPSQAIGYLEELKNELAK